MPTKKTLTLEQFNIEAANFSKIESKHDEPTLFGVTDGKAIGTYLEQKFISYLQEHYIFEEEGNSALGIDIPELNVDIKVTSRKQPQSSSPFRNVRQKIYGLGHHLIVFVYEKEDKSTNRTGRLNIVHTIFVEESCTADFQMTFGLLQIIKNKGNADDIVAFLHDKNLPTDEIEMRNIAEAILDSPPRQGYLTISNALQWRLHYNRAIDEADSVSGIKRIHQL